MVERVLITTALEDTWPEYDTPVLFLGEWCKLYSSKDKWSKFDSMIVPYHWDDRTKLYEDYVYLKKFQEAVLKEIGLKLNDLHDTKKGEKYWEILIAPWLNYFIQIIYDRWFMVDFALKNYDISEANTLMVDESETIPFDYADFNIRANTDLWNGVIYGEILREIGSVPIKEIIDNKDIKGSLKTKGRPRLISKIKESAKTIINWISSSLSSPNNFFLLATYLPRKYEMFLQLKLGQIPKFWYAPETLCQKANIKLREQLCLGSCEQVNFENTAKKLIYKYMPIIYLEGYHSLLKAVEKTSWPSTPRAIFTSNSMYTNEVFKAWTAEKSNNGIPLVLGQHGGNYGSALFSSFEDFELSISDSYLTWGWSGKGRLEKKTKVTCNLKVINKEQKWNPKGQLLVVLMSLPRYSHSIWSSPISSQFNSYLTDQLLFLNEFSESIQKEILVRLFYNDYECSVKERILYQFPNIKIDIGRSRISKLITQCRIYVSTYNATTFLESLSLNVPTIMFWNPEYWELREEAKPYFQGLLKIGILHYTPESAAKKVVEVWDNVEGWWAQEDLQKVRMDFCNQYSRVEKRPLTLLSKTLRSARKN